MSDQSNVEEMAAELADLGATVEETYSGDPYLSIPVGYQLAVEVEPIDMGWSVMVIGWDRTGGISHEQEVATTDRYADALKAARGKAESMLAEAQKLAEEEQRLSDEMEAAMANSTYYDEEN